MMKLLLLLFCFPGIFISCQKYQSKEKFNPTVHHQTEDLTITQLTPYTYLHTSYLNTLDFGRVACHGIFIAHQNEVVIFDTPADSLSTSQLITFIEEELNSQINAVIPTHFHSDCLGGLGVVHNKNIPSYAFHKTISLATEKGFEIPQNSFSDSLVIPVGSFQVIAKFVGEGHTADNTIGYFKEEEVLFGGCLIKSLGSGKGNLEDAHTDQWAHTVTKIKSMYPNIQLVIPGHGTYGDQQLLDYTIELFSKE